MTEFEDHLITVLGNIEHSLDGVVAELKKTNEFLDTIGNRLIAPSSYFDVKYREEGLDGRW